jgi:hypothetical protein
MSVSGIAKLATSIAETGNKQEVAVAVQKRAQQIQSEAATQMIEAIKSTPSANLPPHLGSKINTTA